MEWDSKHQNNMNLKESTMKETRHMAFSNGKMGRSKNISIQDTSTSKISFTGKVTYQ
jgi:hypothetical protein